MFWGLIMEPNKRYTQTVEKPFHISQAAMDTSTGDEKICQVMVVVDGKNFLVCTLQKNHSIQVPLDLYFKTGNVVSFLTNGKSNVHLTGYLDPEFDDELSEGEEEEDEAPTLVPAKGKRKLEAAIESSAKKLKQEAKKQLKKGLETAEDSDGESDDDDEEDGEEEEDDSSDEGDDDLQKLLGGDVDSDENDDSFRPNATADDSDEESGEDEENTTVNTTSEADTSKEEPKKLSKSQKRRLKKQQQKQQKEKEQPQQNGVDKKAKKEGKDKEQKKDKEGVEKKQPATGEREKKSLSGGVFIEDLKVGSGPVAKPGKEVEVYYEGRLKQNNKMFDSCNKGPGFRFRVGHKEVISGWDVGVAGMKVGGKRKIVCPPAMAYGNKGSPPIIPPNSTLVFEVELKKVK